VLDEFLQHALQIPPTEDQQVIQALSPRRLDPALGERVRLGRSCRCPHHLYAFAPEHLIEAGVELGIRSGIKNLATGSPSWEFPGQVARLLRHPGSSRLGGAAGQVNSTAARWWFKCVLPRRPLTHPASEG
jgi:hypothetical protein